MTDGERLASIETTVKDIKERLFGEDQSNGVIGDLDTRLTKLENWRWWVVGMALGLGVAAGHSLTHFLEVLK